MQHGFSKQQESAEYTNTKCYCVFQAVRSLHRQMQFPLTLDHVPSAEYACASNAQDRN